MDVKLLIVRDKLRHSQNWYIRILIEQSISYYKSLKKSHISSTTEINPIDYEIVNADLDYFLLNKKILRICIKGFLHECFSDFEINLMCKRLNIIYNPEVHNIFYCTESIIDHCFSTIGLIGNIGGKRKIILL